MKFSLFGTSYWYAMRDAKAKHFATVWLERQSFEPTAMSAPPAVAEVEATEQAVSQAVPVSPVTAPVAAVA